MVKKGFKDIHELFRKHINDRLAMSVTLNFLIDLDNSDGGVDDSTINKFVNGKRGIPKGLQDTILCKKEWDLKIFIKKYKSKTNVAETVEYIWERLMEGIRDIYDQMVTIPYYNDIKDRIEDTTVLGHIVCKRALPNYKFNCSNIMVCDNFCARDQELNEIEYKIDKYTKVVLYGAGGIGKTQLVKKFLNIHKKINKWDEENREKSYYKDFYIVRYDTNIKNTISNIEFKFNTDLNQFNLTMEEKFCRNMKCLVNKEKDSILVIDGMDTNDYEIELSLLSYLPLHIIVTTRIKFENKVFNNVYVSKMNFIDSKQLFLGHYGQEHKVIDSQLELIFKKIEYHTMVIALVAKAMYKSEISIEEMVGSIKNETIFKNNSLPKVKSGYDGKELIIKGHICNIFKIDNISKSEKELMKHLSCFLNCELNIVYIERWDKVYNLQDLTNLIKGGWIEFVDEQKKKIRIHNLIAESIFYGEKVVIKDCKEIIDEIKKEISLTTALKVEPLVMRKVLFSLYLRFNSTIRNYNNKEQKDISQVKNNWWDFLYRSLLYYIEYSDSYHAKYILETLYNVNGRFVGNYYKGLEIDSCFMKYFWMEGNIKEKNEKYLKISNELLEKFESISGQCYKEKRSDLEILFNFTEQFNKSSLAHLIPYLSDNTDTLKPYIFDLVKSLQSINKIKKEYKLELEIQYYQSLINYCLKDYGSGLRMLENIDGKFQDIGDINTQIKIKSLQIIFGYNILLQNGWELNKKSIIYQYEQELQSLKLSFDMVPMETRGLLFMAKFFAQLIAGRRNDKVGGESDKNKLELIDTIKGIQQEYKDNSGFNNSAMVEEFDYTVNNAIKQIREVD